MFFKSSENRKNGLSIGNNDKKVTPDFATRQEPLKKKVKMLHAGVFLKQEKTEKYSGFP